MNKINTKKVHANDMSEIDISFIVATYNANYCKIIRTLKSIIKQVNIKSEIVIVDDNSTSVQWVDNVKLFLKSNKYYRYKIIINKTNMGTVKNVLNGLNYASGKYIKLISPGDCIIGTNKLKNWLETTVQNGIDWSYCDVICYKQNHNKSKLFKDRSRPQIIKPYLDDNKFQMIWNYCILDDTANGAAILVKKKILEKYLQLIKDRVKFAEDTIYKIMMIDGIVGKYYQDAIVLYECEAGISEKKHLVINEIIYRDYVIGNIIMKEQYEKSKAKDDRIIKALSRKDYTNNRFIKNINMFFLKGKLKFLFKHFLYRRRVNITHSEFNDIKKMI